MPTDSSDYSEDTLVEQPAIALFAELGYDTANCFHETFGSHGTLGRETSADVVLIPRLRTALERLNPGLPRAAIDLAIEELTRDRSIMSPAGANREIYRLLKDGVKVPVPVAEDEESIETVRVIDWQQPSNNDFFLASQLWISGEIYKRRADLVGFVNGLPLIFIELKAIHRRLETAYANNLRDYKTAIPQLFWYNALVLLSNGGQSRVGSITAAWEHFAEWKKITSEGEQGIVSLETMIRGTCAPERLLDIVENFILYQNVQGGLIKLVAKNHQYLGVNNAVQALQQIEHNKGKLGVFWHTQGSGKSFAMVFFAQKVLRTMPGNFTFLVVTDRDELDEQIYKNFADTGALTEEAIQAASGAHLQQLLREDHRYLFTLIQKFHTERGAQYPQLSDRSDIIVMTDEAHRSQYDIFALNMRNALPHAAFIGFTGTPLMVGEEKTREVFGDYVSIYNFRQSVEDGATVPLYYENRVPELQLTNAHLNDDMQRLLEEAELDPDQERQVEREFSREYHLITRDDRLDKVAADIVSHFMGRGHLGKGMVIAIDKATAVKMYEKVHTHWSQYLAALQADVITCSEDERDALLARIAYMASTDMAVVVSQSQNEVEDLGKKGVDIVPHRRRLVREDLDTKFKDPANPLRMVFVCAMWITGFDVPSCSTIYLDKPMRNHTLMQTIARANRVCGDKVNGLIVDYVGMFRDLQRALAIYGSASGGGVQAGETPVEDKSVLLEALRQALAETSAFCTAQGIDVPQILASQGFARVKWLDDAVDAILVNDATKARYLALARQADRLYKAILPDVAANTFNAQRALFVAMADKIRSLAAPVDIAAFMGDVESLLDTSVATEGYVIHDPGAEYRLDLSQIDFEALKDHFTQGRQRTEAEKLRGQINRKLQQMVRLNKSRMDYLERFQQMIDAYNAGSANVQLLFDNLVAFAQELSVEEQRHIAENLAEEELAVFDLLTRPDLSLSAQEQQQVKQVARELLETLKQEKLVLDWRKRQQTRAQVKVTIEACLDRGLPESYDQALFHQKCETLYQHVFDSYSGQGRSVYESVA